MNYFSHLQTCSLNLALGSATLAGCGSDKTPAKPRGMPPTASTPVSADSRRQRILFDKFSYTSMNAQVAFTDTMPDWNPKLESPCGV